MNSIFCKISLISAILFSAVVGGNDNASAASTIKANNQKSMENVLVYGRRVNPTIGITPQANAVGRAYTIVNKHGKVVKRGKIKTKKTFYVATKSLKDGTYCFSIGEYSIQQFEVRS